MVPLKNAAAMDGGMADKKTDISREEAENVYRDCSDLPLARDRLRP